MTRRVAGCAWKHWRQNEARHEGWRLRRVSAQLDGAPQRRYILVPVEPVQEVLPGHVPEGEEAPVVPVVPLRYGVLQVVAGTLELQKGQVVTIEITVKEEANG